MKCKDFNIKKTMEYTGKCCVCKRATRKCEDFSMSDLLNTIKKCDWKIIKGRLFCQKCSEYYNTQYEKLSIFVIIKNIKQQLKNSIKETDHDWIHR
jgi:hypothetical protein